MSFGRRDLRLQTRIPVHYQLLERDTDGPLRVGPLDCARIADLGRHGAFLTDAALPLGAQVHLYLPVGEQQLEIYGVVVHNRPRRMPDGVRRSGMGLRFTYVAPHDAAALEELLAALEPSARLAV